MFGLIATLLLVIPTPTGYGVSVISGTVVDSHDRPVPNAKLVAKPWNLLTSHPLRLGRLS